MYIKYWYTFRTQTLSLETFWGEQAGFRMLQDFACQTHWLTSKLFQGFENSTTSQVMRNQWITCCISENSVCQQRYALNFKTVSISFHPSLSPKRVKLYPKNFDGNGKHSGRMDCPLRNGAWRIGQVGSLRDGLSFNSNLWHRHHEHALNRLKTTAEASTSFSDCSIFCRIPSSFWWQGVAQTPAMNLLVQSKVSKDQIKLLKKFWLLFWWNRHYFLEANLEPVKAQSQSYQLMGHDCCSMGGKNLT